MKLFKFKKVNKLMKRIERIVGKKNMEKAKETINTEAHKGRLYRQTSKGLVVSRNLTTK